MFPTGGRPYLAFLNTGGAIAAEGTDYNVVFGPGVSQGACVTIPFDPATVPTITGEPEESRLSPEAILGQPNVLLPPEAVGGLASLALPFQGEPGTANEGALEIWSVSGQKTLHLPPGVIAENWTPGQRIYPNPDNSLSPEELAALGIVFYRDGQFTLTYNGGNRCR